MVILEHTSIGRNTAKIVGPEAKERITIRDYFYHGSVFVLESAMVRVPARKAASILGPG